MEQKRIVRLAFRRNAITITGICVFMLRVPALGVGRVGDHRIQVQGIIFLGHIVIHGPVLFQGIAAAGKDVIWLNAPHDKVHSCQVIGVFFQFLCIVHDVVFAFSVLRNALTDGNKQGPGAAGRIVDFNFLPVFQMVRNNFRHKLRYFVWGIKLTGLFTSIGRKVTDQVFINKAQNIIILFAIGRDIFD